MRSGFVCLIVYIFSLNSLHAQSIHSPAGPSVVSLEVYSRHLTNPLSFRSNPACIASYPEPCAAVYLEQKFLLNDLRLSLIAIAMPVKSGGLGFQFSYFGSAGYNEAQPGIAYSKKLGTKAEVGVAFNYYLSRVAGYGHTATLNFETGFLFHLTEALCIGLHVYNPIGGNLGKNGLEKLSSIYQAGIGYDVSEQVSVRTEIEKEQLRPIDCKIVLHYAFAQQFFCQVGIIHSGTSLFAAGGWRWKDLRLDLAVAHSYLGFTPGISLSCYFNKSKQ